MFTVTCTTCSNCFPFEVTDVGGIAECPRCGTHQHLMPDQVRAVCDFLKHTHLSYCQGLRDYLQTEEKNVFGMTLKKPAWEATMSFEAGVYLYWWLAFLLQDCEQPPISSTLANILARDTVLLNITPQTAVTRRQIAQLREVIDNRAYQITRVRNAAKHPTDRPNVAEESRQLSDHLAKAMEYRFQKYTACLNNGETYGHVAACCFSHLHVFLNECSAVAKDDLSSISIEDGPLCVGDGLFDYVSLRVYLGVLEQVLIIPYRHVLQTVFEWSDDLLTLGPNEALSLISEAWADAQETLARSDTTCAQT